MKVNVLLAYTMPIAWSHLQMASKIDRNGISNFDIIPVYFDKRRRISVRLS